MVKRGKKDRPVMIPALVGQDKTTLVPSNPRVRSIAYKMRWSVDTVIRRVENALTSPVEQQIYLQVALEYRIHPESLKKMLDIFRGDHDLQPSDLQQLQVGPNLVKSKFDEITLKVEQALLLIDKTSDTSDYIMSMACAAQLVEAYGDYAEEVVAQIINNMGSVADLLEIKNPNPKLVVGVAISVLVKTITDMNFGEPYPLTIEEMFRRPTEWKKRF